MTNEKMNNTKKIWISPEMTVIGDQIVQSGAIPSGPEGVLTVKYASGFYKS